LLHVKRAFFGGGPVYQLFITEGGCTALISQSVGSAACEELWRKSHSFTVSAIFSLDEMLPALKMHWHHSGGRFPKTLPMQLTRSMAKTCKTVRQKKNEGSDMDQFLLYTTNVLQSIQKLFPIKFLPPKYRILPPINAN